MIEPRRFGLRMSGDQRFGPFDRDKFVHPAEYEQLRHFQTVQHVVHIVAADHPVQQRHNAVVVGRRDQLLQLFDPPAKPFAVRLGKTFRSEKRGDQFFLIAADQFDLAASVLFFRIGIGIRRRVEQNQPLQHFGITGRKSFGDVSPIEVPGHETARDALLVEHPFQHIGHELHAMHLAPHLRDAVTGNVDRDHTVVGRQQFREILPHFREIPGSRAAVRASYPPAASR